MTGSSLRLSALLLLLLGRWASADLEKGEDEFVRSWVIIEEQLVPPSSRDELLAGGVVGGGGGAASAGGGGRRITPKSVFVAPSFNKCSDGYQPDKMGRCVKVVKLNQAAQWDFLLKRINSMYGPGGGFPMPPPAAVAAVTATTTTVTATPTTAAVESLQQNTDSPGPFQLNIPLAGVPEPVAAGNQTAADDRWPDRWPFRRPVAADGATTVRDEDGDGEDAATATVDAAATTVDAAATSDAATIVVDTAATSTKSPRPSHQTEDPADATTTPFDPTTIDDKTIK